MGIFKRKKIGENVGTTEPSLNESSWDNMGSGFNQEAAEENRRIAEAEKVERSRAAQVDKMKREIIDKIAHGNAGYFLSEVQNGRVDDERKREFLNEVYAPRPVDTLEVSYSSPSLKEEREKKGISPLGWACETQFGMDLRKMNETHYRRILLGFAGGDPNHPENASKDTYEDFVGRFETIFDFHGVSGRFVDSIGVKRPDGSIDRAAVEKKNEYRRDMEEFEWLLFGNQMAALKAFEELEKEAADYEPEVADVNDAKPVQETGGAEVPQEDILEGPDQTSGRYEGPKIGQDLGNGYICASQRFQNNREAYQYMKEYGYGEGYTTFSYDDGVYIVTRK